VSPLEGRHDPRLGELRSTVRVRREGEELEGVWGRELLEGPDRGREVLPQRRTQPEQVTGAVPDQGLVHPGDDFDGLRFGAVAGDLPVMGAVDADDLGE